MNRADLPLIEAGWLQLPSLQKLFDILEADGLPARVVGGAVRNSLMQHEVAEVDLATPLRPEEVMARVEAAGEKAVGTGVEHGTVTVVIGGVSYEVTTLREDIQTDGRHAVVRFGENWEKDASRRDLTINALYCGRNGEVYDPIGGLNDIETGTVRFIGDASKRIHEDGLRILRFFRFFAHYGKGRPDADGLKACAASLHMLEGLSVERIWMELKKLLAAKDPTRALLWMRTTKVLGAVLPETEKWGIDLISPLVQMEQAFHLDVDVMIRLMGMIRPEPSVAAGLSERLRLSRVENERLCNWAAASLPTLDVPIEAFEKMLYRQENDAIADALLLEGARVFGEGDASARKPVELAIHARNWKAPDFPVQGRDLLEMGYKPGPEVGEKLAKLEDEWVESGFKLSRDELLK